MSGKYRTDKVKSWLSEFRENDRDVENQLERLERMRAQVESCAAPELTDMPKTPGVKVDKMSMMIARIVDLERSLGDYVERQEEYLHRIEYVVEKLPRSRERAIIRLRYEDGAQWADIAFSLFGDNLDYTEREDTYKRRLHDYHNDALYNLAVYFQDSGDPEVEFYKDYIPRSRRI